MEKIPTGLQRSINYTKTPLNLHDNDIAFVSFIGWANGNSKDACLIREQFTEQHDATGKTYEQSAAEFIDWLIANYWGEEPEIPI